MAHDLSSYPTGIYRGRVTSLAVSGVDRESAQILLTVAGAGVEGPEAGASAAFVVASQPSKGEGHEPQVFAAFATLLVSALERGVLVDVFYRARKAVNEVTVIKLPSVGGAIPL